MSVSIGNYIHVWMKSHFRKPLVHLDQQIPVRGSQIGRAGRMSNKLEYYVHQSRENLTFCGQVVDIWNIPSFWEHRKNDDEILVDLVKNSGYYSSHITLFCSPAHIIFMLKFWCKILCNRLSHMLATLAIADSLDNA